MYAHVSHEALWAHHPQGPSVACNAPDPSRDWCQHFWELVTVGGQTKFKGVPGCFMRAGRHCMLAIKTHVMLSIHLSGLKFRPYTSVLNA